MFMKSKGKSNVLDLDNSDSEGASGFGNIDQLNLNNQYAKNYNKWRSSEELQKRKDRYGEDALEDDESSASTSEEEWTADKEKAFLKTFSALKKKDPTIYDSNIYFFKNAEEVGESSKTVAVAKTDSTVDQNGPTSKKVKKDKNKPFSLKDHERKMVLEKEGLLSDSDSDNNHDVKNINNHPSYVQQLANIKKGFSDALQTIDSDDEGDDYKNSDLLKPRKKSENEQKQDEDDYFRWLKGERTKLDTATGKITAELQFLKDYWSDPNLNADEKFLRDYVLNRKYQDEDDKNRIPSYDEVVHDSDEEGLSGDEEEVKKMEEFEHKYNFRFEEPDQDFIKRYPRTVESSLRRTDEKRKKQRESVKERKEAEKERKREEVQRLKAIKREEILEKLKQIEAITGDPSLNFDDKDVEGDFDPEEHDQRMQKIFSEHYYENANDAEKPVFEYDDELDGEEWKAFCPSDEESLPDPLADDIESTAEEIKKSSKGKSKKNKPNDDTEDTEEPKAGPSSTFKKNKSFIDELIEASRGKRKGNKKKSSIFLQALERSKPKFDSKVHQSFQDYFDEYYQLDFEDLIGDIPCRFKYRKVTPNDFGLSTEEILKVPDRELNQWASVKKTYTYRTPEEEKYDVQAYKQKASNIQQKKKVLPTLFHNEDADDEDDDQEPFEPTVATNDTTPSETSSKKKKNKKKKKKKKLVTQADQNEVNMDETVEGKTIFAEMEHEETQSPVAISNNLEPQSKKSKKKKSKHADNISIPIATEISNNINVNDSTASIAEVQPPESESAVELRKSKKKKKSKKESSVISTNSTTEVAETVVNEQGNAKVSNNRGTKRKFPKDQEHSNQKNKNNSLKEKNGAKKLKGNRNSQDAKLVVDDERLRAYGINPNKYKKGLKYGNKTH